MPFPTVNYCFFASYKMAGRICACGAFLSGGTTCTHVLLKEFVTFHVSPMDPAQSSDGGDHWGLRLPLCL